MLSSGYGWRVPSREQITMTIATVRNSSYQNWRKRQTAMSRPNSKNMRIQSSSGHRFQAKSILFIRNLTIGIRRMSKLSWRDEANWQQQKPSGVSPQIFFYFYFCFRQTEISRGTFLWHQIAICISNWKWKKKHFFSHCACLYLSLFPSLWFCVSTYFL